MKNKLKIFSKSILDIIAKTNHPNITHKGPLNSGKDEVEPEHDPEAEQSLLRELLLSISSIINNFRTTLSS